MVKIIWKTNQPNRYCAVRFNNTFLEVVYGTRNSSTPIGVIESSRLIFTGNLEKPYSKSFEGEKEIERIKTNLKKKIVKENWEQLAIWKD